MRHACVPVLISALCLSAFIASDAQAQELSPTRKLRRVHLTLVQHEPDFSRYEELLAAPDPDAFIAQEVDALMATPEYLDNLRDWSHEYIPFPLIGTGRVWRANKTINTSRCGSDTLHSGAIAIIGAPNANEPGICDNPNAAKNTTTPWWDPSTPVDVVGVAANEALQVDGKDCGVIRLSNYWKRPDTQGCGCGPHLTFCGRGDIGLPYENSYPKGYEDGEIYHPASQARSVMEEPADLFTFIITEQRPFSDLILANYSVVNRGLYHMYVRQGRQSGVYTDRDTDRWFDMFSDDEERLEVLTSAMNPHLIDNPDYRYDPRVDSNLLGVPSSGVLTMIGPNFAWPRPRVRAARWLESLACDEFSPPELPIQFPTYQRDPATEGVCLHCHTRLDPAAISFKRSIRQGGALAGVGNWKLGNMVSYDSDRQRFTNSLLADTVLTPLTQQEIDADLDNRLIDFLPPDQQLLGQTSDGTIGPRGFAKILLASGKFDQCAVQRAYQRFGGKKLDLGRDARELDEATEAFVASGRNMNELIRQLVLSRETGW